MADNELFVICSCNVHYVTLFEVVFHNLSFLLGVMVFIFLFLHGIRLRTRLRRDKQPLADGWAWQIIGNLRNLGSLGNLPLTALWVKHISSLPRNSYRLLHQFDSRVSVHISRTGVQLFVFISEVIDISPSNLDSSSCFFQPSVSHDVLCIYGLCTMYQIPDSLLVFHIKSTLYPIKQFI